MMMQKYIFVSFLNEIAEIGRRNEIDLSQKTVSLIISARDIHTFREAAEELFSEFCDRIQERRKRDRNDEASRICNYIREHFAEYDLSMDRVAEEVGVSLPAVRKAVQERTGKNYKDYLIYLRVEYAKLLLVKESLTVAEVCEKVGYGNISYFIKAFKKMTGVTSAVYRNQACSG